jgi:hypothetical protein
MSLKKTYTIDDFTIGESVVPLNAKELTLIVVSINKEQNVIICQLPTERAVRAYFPEELEKEFIVRPPNILDNIKPKDDAKETAED